MGIDKTDDLPDPLNGKGKFWLENEAGERLLRPNFNLPLGKNLAWLDELLQRVQKDGWNEHGVHAKKLAQELNMTELKKRLSSTTYKNLQKKYKQQCKDEADQVVHARQSKIFERKAKVRFHVF